MLITITYLIIIALCYFSCVAVASLLLVVYADGLEFAELTVSAIQSTMLTYERLLNTSEDTKIRGLCTKFNVYLESTISFSVSTLIAVGLDYHFYRKEVYLTQNNHYVTRFPVVLDETTMLNSLRRTAGNECTNIQHVILMEMLWIQQR